MKKIAIACALSLGLGAAAQAQAGDWILVGADENAVASLWLVKQARAQSPQVELEDYIEFEETDTTRAYGVSRFTLYDCKAGTVKRGPPQYHEPGYGDEFDDYGGGPNDWDTAPRKPGADSYDAKLLALACAVDRNDPALASYPRLPQPFMRADADRAIAKTDPNWKPTTPRWQGLAIADPASGVFGITAVSDQPTRDAAETQLQRRCTDNGWSNCGTVVSRQCVAVAYIERELVYFGGTGKSEADAIRDAHAKCTGEGLSCDNDMASCP